MNFEAINRYLSQRITISEEQLSEFNQMLTPMKVKKKQLLSQAGEICNFEYYIVKGCVRVYYINENGFEVDLLFAVEDWWVGDLASFSQRTPSKLYLQALEDTELLAIDFETKEKLYQRIPSFERLFRLMIQRTHESLMNRLIANISESAESRYLAFIKKYPSIPLRVPQHLIASYLGVSPEFLSKIRAKLSRQGR